MFSWWKNEIGEVFINLFNRKIPLSKDMVSKIQDKQKEIFDVLIMIDFLL
jgi:hypothetical protein